MLIANLFEPRHEKTCLRGLRPGKTKTGLHNYKSLEISGIETRGILLFRQRTTTDVQADLCLCCSHMA